MVPLYEKVYLGSPDILMTCVLLIRMHMGLGADGCVEDEPFPTQVTLCHTIVGLTTPTAKIYFKIGVHVKENCVATSITSLEASLCIGTTTRTNKNKKENQQNCNHHHSDKHNHHPCNSNYRQIVERYAPTKKPPTATKQPTMTESPDSAEDVSSHLSL